MNRTAVHMRITGLNVSNEDVDTRKSAAAKLGQMWSRSRNRRSVVQKASEVATALGGDGIPPESLAMEVEGVIQTYASAFLHSERPLEVGICAGVAVIDLMAGDRGSSGWTAVDVLATALWSALGFQPALEDAKREDLRTEVLEVARSRTVDAGELARERKGVSDFGDFRISEGKWANVPVNFKKATGVTIRALRRNAALDREELDFLWWAQLGRSRLLDKRFSEIDESVRLIAVGIEAANHLRRLPCENHRDVALRTLDKNPEKDLNQLVSAVGCERRVLGAPYADSDGIVFGAPFVFPLLHALATGSTLGDGARIKRTAAEWGARALLEASLVKLLSTGPVEL